MEVNKNLSEKALEDYDLVKRAVNYSDQQAYSELLKRYRDSIFHMMLKMVHNREDADDLTLEAFGKAFRRLDSYSPKYAFSTWLFKIAINNAIDFIRKKRLHLLSIDDSMMSDSDQSYSSNLRSNTLDPEQKYIRDQKLVMTRRLLERLSHKYRLMIELRFFEELSYDQISKELNIPLGTVKAQLFRAKEILSNLAKTQRVAGRI
ncbi:MAG: sigma-70 family RNA polymerase sigma factor [Bacteroidota bacterium]